MQVSNLFPLVFFSEKFSIIQKFIELWLYPEISINDYSGILDTATEENLRSKPFIYQSLSYTMKQILCSIISQKVMYKQIADRSFGPDDTVPMMRYLSSRISTLENLDSDYSFA